MKVKSDSDEWNKTVFVNGSYKIFEDTYGNSLCSSN
jgi:hypothetical protein